MKRATFEKNINAIFEAFGWASFRDGLLFDFTFANSRGGLVFKMNVVNNEIDDYKTMSKTTNI